MTQTQGEQLPQEQQQEEEQRPLVDVGGGSGGGISEADLAAAVEKAVEAALVEARKEAEAAAAVTATVAATAAAEVQAAAAGAAATAAETAATAATATAAAATAAKEEAELWRAKVAAAVSEGEAAVEAVRLKAASQAEALMEASAYAENEAAAREAQVEAVSRQRAQEVEEKGKESLKEAKKEAQQQSKEAADSLKKAHAAEAARLKGKAAAAEESAKELGKQVAALQEAAADGGDKDGKIAGLTMEGQKLARKQGELQKLIRDKNGKLEELEKDKARGLKDKEQLEASVAKLTHELSAHQSKVGDTSKSLQAMQAVSQASSDKLSSVEAELRQAREGEADLRVALDKAWACEKEQKRGLHALTAEAESLRSQLGNGEEARKAVEEVKRELSVRELLLQATQRQLEDRLTRTEHEASLREDALRQEVADMRRRWQDATQRSEGIAADVHETTSPLLRQIRSLQEEGRARAAAWATAESALLDRAGAAEEASTRAQQAKLSAEEKAGQCAAEGKAAQEQVRELKSAVAVATAEGRSMAAQQVASEDRAVEAEAEAEALRELVRRGGLDLKAVQAKHRLLAEEKRGQHEASLSDLASEKDTLEEQVAQLKAAASADSRYHHHPSTPVRSGNTNGSPSPSPRSKIGGGGEEGGEDSSSSGMLSSSSEHSDMFGGLGTQPGHQPGGCGGGGGAFVVQLEKLHLTVKQRESECLAARQRCGQVEAVCDALTSEVQELGRRHGDLEAVALEAPKLKKQNAKLKQKNNVLLELLGEKTEELEDMQQRLENAQPTPALP